MYIYIYIYIKLRINIYVYIYILYIYINLELYIYTHTHTHIYIYIYIYNTLCANLLISTQKPATNRFLTKTFHCYKVNIKLLKAWKQLGGKKNIVENQYLIIKHDNVLEFL